MTNLLNGDVNQKVLLFVFRSQDLLLYFEGVIIRECPTLDMKAEC